ncbi:MAG: D-alanine--poly(phosphoribitol) ligase subunit 2 [Oscillospiraceae bacterium]|nr:D-alanine--poly(phosphoribitol) ligase subunit 2 [Oscillospiraceae bacterium]
MTEKIIALLLDICGADEGEIQPDTELFEEGILDSFGLVQLLVEMEGQLGVSLDPAALERSAISTPAKLAAAAQA